MTEPSFAQRVYFIGSGKGGVGKSTLAVNISVALAAQGRSVSLLDADLYGPSLPLFFGLRKLQPRSSQGKIIPFTKYGVHVMSLGFLVEEARSILWRGPMLHGMLEKMLFDVAWPESDVLVIDLPPGTGDVPLSLSQLLPIEGAYAIITPQEVARLDAVKAINAWNQMNIPLLGVIENMQAYPEKKGFFKRKSKAEEFAKRFRAPFLGSVPFLPELCQACEEGIPLSFHQGEENQGSVFHELARHMMQPLPA